MKTLRCPYCENEQDQTGQSVGMHQCEHCGNAFVYGDQADSVLGKYPRCPGAILVLFLLSLVVSVSVAVLLFKVMMAGLLAAQGEALLLIFCLALAAICTHLVRIQQRTWVMQVNQMELMRRISKALDDASSDSS